MARSRLDKKIINKVPKFNIGESVIGIHASGFNFEICPFIIEHIHISAAGISYAGATEIDKTYQEKVYEANVTASFQEAATKIHALYLEKKKGLE